MKKSLKRIISLLLAFNMALSYVPVLAHGLELEIVGETEIAEEEHICGEECAHEEVSETEEAVEEYFAEETVGNTDLMHIICYGQSFSVGADAPGYADPIVDGAYVLGSVTGSTVGDELLPLQVTSGTQHPVISAVNTLSQMMTNNGIDIDIIAGSYGSGGRTIAQLMSDERQAQIKEEEEYTYDINSSGKYNVFQNSVEAVADYAKTNGQSVSCPAIIFLQGETDQNTDAELGYPENATRAGYGAGGDKEKYKEYMTRLKEDMQKEVMEVYGQTEKPLFIIYQVSGTYVRTPYSSINMAQLEFAQENDDVILLQTPYFAPHYTNSHHLTVNGYRWLGEYIGQAIYTAITQREKTWPVLPEKFTVEDGNTLRITMSGAVNGLTIDTWTVEDATNSSNKYGFNFSINGSRVVPETVEVDGNDIVLTLPDSAVPLDKAKSVYIYYGGQGAKGTGNIRDNCTKTGFYQYLDDSADTGTGNNQGVSHSALDENGNSIIGQAYPLYNWLASFCYEIEIPEGEQKQAAFYHWEMQEAGLVCVSEDKNYLTLAQGSVENGILTGVQYGFEETIVLYHDRPWVIEWNAAGNGGSYGGGMLLSAEDGSGSKAGGLYLPADSRGFVAWNVSSESRNYGIKLGAEGIDTREEHTYRIENRIAEDGTNTVYLIVDGVEIGDMNTPYSTSNGSLVEDTTNWVNGADIYLKYIGKPTSFLLNNMKLSYLKIYESEYTTSAETDSTFTSTSDAVAYIRSQMVARVRPITVTISGAALSEAEVNGIINSAFEHTGVPNEGDYLLANKVGQTVTIETGTDANGDYTTITADINWISSAEQEAEVDAAVEAVLNELDLWNKTDYEKIKGAYDWITENVQYDWDWDDTEPDPNYHKHSTHAAIIDKEAVCQGYASLYYRFMLELGIDCRYISGTAGYVEPESHAWNIVRLEDKYYNMDATWDRDLMGHYRMFLCTEANFTEHIRDGEYATADFYAKYPMAVVPYVFNVTASGKLSNGMEWVLDGDTGTLTVAGKGAIPSYRYSYAPWYNYRESVKSIVISEGITEVGERAFYWCTNCTSLTLPQSLVTIQEYGFNNLRALEEVTLPSNLKTMEFCAFSECVALKSITIPDSVTTVGTSVFSNCYGLQSAVIGSGIKQIPNSMFFGDKNLRKVTLPEGLTYIGDTAFADCGLNGITLPATLTGLGSSVFSGNRTMTMIYVEEGNTVFKDVSGVLFSIDGKRLICYPAGKISFNYTVPAGTEVIARSAFNDVYRLEHVYFPDSLREIEAYAFAYSNLWSVTLNENITKVGDSAFRSCKNLYSVIFENQSVNLVGYTFADCTNLQIAYLPKNITEIPNGLFDGCIRLEEVTIPSTVTKIGSSAFLDCDALTTITIPGSVKSIGQQAFDFCQNLKTIIFEDGIQSLGWLCIRNNPNLTKVVIPESVTTFVQPSNASSKTFENCPKVVLYVKCGSTAYYYAKDRGLSMSLTHNYANKTTVAPTCTAMGYTLYTCYCGASYRINDKDALGHSYKTEVIAPTCTEQGYTVLTCTRCGYSYKANYTAAKGHTVVIVGYVEPTCTESGYSGDRTCEVCGITVSSGVVIPAAGHAYETTVTAPTCTEQGYTTHACSVCGDSYVDSYVEAKGHSFGEWTVETEPKWEENGIKIRICTVCLKEEREEIPSLIEAYPDILHGHLQQLPENIYAHTNIWELLEPENEYFYGGTNWGTLNEVVSVTIPISEGDKIYASSFERGIRITYFDENGVLVSISNTDIQTEFFENGYITVPAGAIAVNIPMWDNSSENVLKILTLEQIECEEHSFGQWKTEVEAGLVSKGTMKRSCENCGFEETKEVPELMESGYYSYSGEEASIELPYRIYYPSSYENGEDKLYPVVIFYHGAGSRGTDNKAQVLNKKLVDRLVESDNCIVIAPQCAEGHQWVNTPWGNGSYDSNAVDESIFLNASLALLDEMISAEKIDEDYVYAAGLSMGGYATWSVIMEYPEKFAAAIPICGAGDPSKANDILGVAIWAFHGDKDTTVPVSGSREMVEAISNLGGKKIKYTEYEGVAHDSWVNAFAEPELLEWLFAQKKHIHVLSEWIITTEPTCTEKGEERRECESCGYSETREVEAKGHDYEAVVTEPTCTEQGYTTYTCRCGESYVDDYVEAKGHTEVIDKAVEPTCTETGLTEGKHCSVCGEILVAQTVVKAKGHAEVIDKAVEPTCTETGLTEGKHCSVCGEILVAQTVVTAKGHTEIIDKAVAPTCTETGLTEGKHCSVCGEVLVAQTVVPAKGHDYKAVVTEPTCEEQGYTTHTCSVCGDSYVDSYVNATGHSFGEWKVAKEATCEAKGIERRDCENCDHYETRDIKATGHTEVIDKAVEPTCTETGLTEGKHCSVCGEILVAQTVVPAKGHDYKAVVTEPTCEEQGYTTHTCSVCGDSYVDSYVNATGHSFGEWYETKAPTAAEKGEERRDCANCDYYEVREIGAIAVLYGDVNGDGRVNVLDANLIRRYAARLITFDDSQLIAADVNGDERVNVLDANLVRRFAARLIDKFPIEEK